MGAAYSEHNTENQTQTTVTENIEALIGNLKDAQLEEETAQVILFDEIETPIQLPRQLEVLGTELVNFLGLGVYNSKAVIRTITSSAPGIPTWKPVSSIFQIFSGNIWYSIRNWR